MTKISYKPDGYADVTPWIIGRDTAGLMDFLKRAPAVAWLVCTPVHR